MGSVGTGGTESSSVRWVGPAEWGRWCDVIHSLGGSLDDLGPNDPEDVELPGFDGGFLAGLSASTARAAAELLVVRSGRPAVIYEVALDAQIERTSVEITAAWTREHLSRDLRWSAAVRGAGGASYDADEGVRTEALAWMFSQTGSVGEVVDRADWVPPTAAGHPSLAARRVHLVAPPDRPPPPTTGGVRFIGAERTVVRSPAQVEALLAELEALGRLDDRARPPDLSRWVERALRRAGLAAVPSPDDPAYAVYQQTFDALTARDRSAPGAGDAWPRWRLTAPGTWRATAAEVAVLAQVVPALRGLGDTEVVVAPPPAAPAPPDVPAPAPWPTSPPRRA